MVGAYHLNSELIQDSHFVKFHSRVKTGLSSECRKDRVRPFFFYYPGYDFRSDRLYICPVGHIGVGHYGGWVRIYKNNFVSFLPEGLTRLASGIIKLAGLTDYYRSRPDYKYAFYVVSFWHNKNGLKVKRFKGQKVSEKYLYFFFFFFPFPLFKLSPSSCYL